MSTNSTSASVLWLAVFFPGRQTMRGEEREMRTHVPDREEELPVLDLAQHLEGMVGHLAIVEKIVRQIRRFRREAADKPLRPAVEISARFAGLAGKNLARHRNPAR